MALWEDLNEAAKKVMLWGGEESVLLCFIVTGMPIILLRIKRAKLWRCSPLLTTLFRPKTFDFEAVLET